MYERPTHSVVLPLSKATVILYDFLVKKELDEIKRIGLQGADIDFEKNPKNPEVKKFDVGVTIAMEDTTMKLSIQKFAFEGQDYVMDRAQIVEFVDNLREEDATVLAGQIEGINKASALSDEDKKK